MPVRVAQFLHLRQHRFNGHSPAGFFQRIGGQCLHGDFAHHAEAAHRHATGVEEIRIFRGAGVHHVACRRHEAETGDGRRNRTEADARAMCACAHRPRDCLPVDVTLIGKAHAAIKQHRAKIADRRARLDPRRVFGAVMVEKTRHFVERDDRAAAFDKSGERMPAACNAHRRLRHAHGVGEFFLACRFDDCVGPGFNPTRPVRPDVRHSALPQFHPAQIIG